MVQRLEPGIALSPQYISYINYKAVSGELFDIIRIKTLERQKIVNLIRCDTTILSRIDALLPQMRLK